MPGATDREGVPHPDRCVALGPLVAVGTAATTGLGLVHLDAPAPEVAPVEGADRVLCGAPFLHLDEGEASRAASLAIHDDVHALDGAVPFEGVARGEFALGRRNRQEGSQEEEVSAWFGPKTAFRREEYGTLTKGQGPGLARSVDVPVSDAAR